ncbi:hypothetical protein FY136_28785 (plasmid) [Agrobacterium tumefaciens]|uniref:hypothetical protein n=1 Tax=Agrobacterium tumefaciens TaxID=358 RepID=UPI0021CE58C1|nr:hypothetical protein [Agrobacterium tumefaciens]UXT53260.1 hypothetical protein FY136_28785 [Agrobacterium tumefaciens]
MTQHERQLVAAEELPALDGEILPPNTALGTDPDEKLPFPPLAKVIPDTIEALDPNWDVSQIATRGHVLVARAQAASQALNMPMTLLGIWCVTSIVGAFVGSAVLGLIGLGVVVLLAAASLKGVNVSRGSQVLSGLLLVAMVLASLGKLPLGSISAGASGSLPMSVRSMFVFDPDTYFDLGGGLKGGPDLAWMGEFKPRPESLSQVNYDTLVKAVQADVAAHGKEAGAWSAIPALKVQPMVTRPNKAFPQYGSRLKDGIVLIPEDFQPVSVIAHTQGQWSITFVAAGGCMTVLGPVASGCQNGVTSDDPLNGNLRRYLAEIQPKQTAEQE